MIAANGDPTAVSTETAGPGARPAATILVDHYSTASLPPDQRHAAWSHTGWPSVAALFDSEPLEDFTTEADLVHLDQLLLQYARGTARQFDRTSDRALADGIDVLGIGIQLDGGAMVGDAAGRAFHAGPGEMLMLDMTLPCSMTHPSGPSIQIALPRVLAQHFLGAPGVLHGTVVSAPRAAMLVSHLLQLRQALRTMPLGQQTILMRTVLDLLAVALGRQAIVELPAPVGADAPVDRVKEAAKREIEQRLGLPSLRTASLCERLNISRSRLFRLFEAEGGVASYIMARRLENVRATLERPSETPQISELAYRFGFSDTSHLTKRFRKAYGVTPTAYRAMRRRAAAPGVPVRRKA